LFTLLYLVWDFSFSLLESIMFNFGACSNWTRVEEDSREAIKLDSNLVKVIVIYLLFSFYCGTRKMHWLEDLTLEMNK